MTLSSSKCLSCPIKLLYSTYPYIDKPASGIQETLADKRCKKRREQTETARGRGYSNNSKIIAPGTYTYIKREIREKEIEIRAG